MFRFSLRHLLPPQEVLLAHSHLSSSRSSYAYKVHGHKNKGGRAVFQRSTLVFLQFLFFVPLTSHNGLNIFFVFVTKVLGDLCLISVSTGEVYFWVELLGILYGKKGSCGLQIAQQYLQILSGKVEGQFFLDKKGQKNRTMMLPA